MNLLMAEVVAPLSFLLHVLGLLTLLVLLGLITGFGVRLGWKLGKRVGR